MSCDLTENKLEAYVLGLLDEVEAQQVQQHMQTCQTCQQRAAALKNAAHVIERGFDQAPPAYLRSKVLANLRDHRKPKVNWLAWAAPALVGAAVVVLMIKIEPGRLMKEQALAPVASAQNQTEAAPVMLAKKPAASVAASGPIAYQTDKKALRAAVPAPAQPAGFIQEEQAKPAPQAKYANQALEKSLKADDEKKEAEAPNREAVSEFKAKKVLSKDLAAPAKSEVDEVAFGGGVRSMSAPAPAAMAMKSRHREVEQEDMLAAAPAPAPAPAAGERLAAKALACTVILAGTEGGLDSQQLQAAIGQFTQQVRARVLQANEAKTVLIRISLDAQGNVKTAEFVGSAFVSADLKQFMLGEIRSLHFPQPTALPASVTIKIEVK